MKISRLDAAQFVPAYGIFCSPIQNLNDRAGMYSTFCQISPGKNTTVHAHFEPELFYIIRGSGLMIIDNKMEKIYAGDLIQIPPFSHHQLKNLGKEELVFLSVYSEDTEIPTLPPSIIITSAPPTPNGPLHLGHISGPYLASDILTRYLRLRSVKVENLCGTDDHQNYVQEKAHTLSVSTESFRCQMRSRIQAGFAHMNIEFDELIEPTKDIVYQNHVQHFIQRAIASNVIDRETIEFPYCVLCNKVLIDASIIGYCPCCKEESHGSCEHCGIVVPPYELHNITCVRCQNSSSKKLVPVYTFELNKHLPAITAELRKLSLPLRLEKLIERVSQMKHLKVLVTYPHLDNHGIFLAKEEQTCHVWFEMAAHYEQFALSNTFWTHCFGFDNSFYYLLFIPSLLRAMHPEAKLPDSVITNEFLQLEGYKFSTSRDHAIWAESFADNVDHLRLYLSLNRPSKQSENFSIKEFQVFSSNLAQQLQKLNQRAECVLHDIDFAISPQILIDCNRATRNMEYYLSPTQNDFRRASQELVWLVNLALQSESQCGEKLILHALAMLMTPFMPVESEHLFNSLKISSRTWVKNWENIYAVT